ncbi:sugar phosphate isomerase/epimerase family protein [Paenibacillus sp. JX-17]|uniref:Sugar phosphate isomerase/epimerase family protein n=1 Tax=Paenibacillus lacisoli TaxID=3064525 RepID=A0ABT9CFD3_9BACL|nr:sugar phosphate isomerase/epimerase family protein [Paenibacillus sp. JX-17]MDO7907986.1 sugar phosphate isomerase/epimerase family protein [Paenibacillus sp. JX-17]
MRLSVFTVCTPDLLPAELISAAASAGIHGIEWRYAAIPADAQQEPASYWRHNRCSIDPEHAAETIPPIVESMQRQGLTAAALVPYLQCGDLAAAEQAFTSARQLESAMIRVGIPRYDRTRYFRDLEREAVTYLSAVQEMAQQYQVKALVETHHETITPSASLALRLIQHLNPDLIGVLYDPGNMVHEGYENYRMGLELLGPYLAHVHVKNAGWYRSDHQWRCRWEPLFSGMVPWEQLIGDLQHVQYSGYLGVEDFSGQSSSADMLQYFAQWFTERI